MIPSLPAREPSRLFLHLLPCLVLAVCCTVLFSWRPLGKPPEHAYFEAALVSPQPGSATFRYGVDGAGLGVGHTEPQAVAGGRNVARVKFPIPAGKLGALNFTPRVETGVVDILRCWLTSEAGEVLAVFPPELLATGSSMPTEVLPGGVLRYHASAGEKNLGVILSPTPPMELGIEPSPAPWKLALVFALSLAGSLALSLAFGDRLAAAGWIASALAWARRHPVWTLFLAAAFSVTLSCHPVIFFGKSFVSPDNGLTLLYDKNPTVPGAYREHTDNPVGADLGATMFWHLPVSMIQHRAIFQDHEFPLWNRYNWSGLTLFGQSLSMIGDPLDWPVIAAGGAAWAWDGKFIAAQLLFAFAIGLVVRRSSGSLPAALLLTLSAPFMGFFTYRYNHAAYFSLCYSPWILLAWIEGARAPTVRRAAVWAAFLIFADWWELNSGTAKEMSALLLFINAAGGLMLLLAAQPPRWRWTRLAVFAWANIVFLLLSAPLWMTFLDALGKAHTSYDEPRIYQITPGLAVGLFDDIFYRQFMPSEFLFSPSANFLVLLGVMWTLLRARALAAERMLWAVTLPAVAAAALAFGVVSPATAATIPFLNNIYHFYNTFSCVLFILLFVVAGFGLRECVNRVREGEWRGDWLLALAFIGVLVASYFGLTDAAHRVGKSFLKAGETIPKSPFFCGYVPALLIAVAIFPWALRQALLRRPAAAAWALVALCAFATLHFRSGMYLQSKFDYYVRNPKSRLDLRHLSSPALDAVRHASTEPSRVLGLDWEMVPGFSAALGFETISGPDALMNPAMLQLIDLLGVKRMWDWRVKVDEDQFASAHRALDLLNVRFLLGAANKEKSLPGTKVISDSDFVVFENETAWPRAFFTDTVGAYDSGAELRSLVEQGDGRPFAALPTQARAELPLPARDFAQRLVQPAHGYHLTNNTTTFEIDAPSSGVAVLLEANVPDDIVATIDGEPTTCLPINHAFRGVVIPQPGHYVIRFEYWPAAFQRALSVAFIGLIALLASLWVWWRAGRAKPQAAPVAPTPEPALSPS